MKLNFFILIYFFGILAHTQTTSFSTNQIRAIENNNLTFYNVNGIQFTSRIYDAAFTKKNLKKAFRQYKVKKANLESNPLIEYENLSTKSSEEIAPGFNQHTSTFFVKNQTGKIQAIRFSYFEPIPDQFANQLIKSILKKKISKENYDPPIANQINFADRVIDLENNCQWMNINNIQCPYNGQMNWSLHNSLESAKKSNAYQLKTTTSKKGGKIILESSVSIVFEGKSTQAKKIVYDFTGIKSVLAGVSGGKTLTIYYITEKIRGHYLSCVLSHWNNDNLNANGLPLLLAKVMAIQE